MTTELTLKTNALAPLPGTRDGRFARTSRPGGPAAERAAEAQWLRFVEYREPAGPTAEPSLARHWLTALAEESREGALLERLALAGILFASGLALVAAISAGAGLVNGWESFVNLVATTLP